ncbi:hypothetical protein LTR84_012777 [Exophiala bonariae]|uniref:Uncharacterized protein n=1 Tax=Exophiala bonariae TaxID=1690606 RepID=A0AAV9NIQ5_9EURO|nr:hypothetical protein LTR84_012777 [Exophiala bonariae]
MNVFKKKGKAKDDTYIIPPAQPVDAPAPSKMSRSLKRKQKHAVEPKIEVDLTTVLPETNDFRTSLLMPGLSARFSMLREQDDPNTKLGKASDDSVLFPKRASRLNLFAHNPLTEISETESIRLPYRPPFAEPERSLSFSEVGNYASDDNSSLLNRSRPTESNNLFGGRQKMYRVPTATSSNGELGDEVTPMASSKHVYQKDIPSSPYQQYRAKTREESRERAMSSETDEHDNSSVVNTPSTGFSKSRGTASSTASGPSNRRTSTAATSVTSDSPALRQSNMSGGFNSRTNASDFGSEESLLKRNFSSESRRGFPFNDHVNQPPLPNSPIIQRALPQSRSATNLTDKFGGDNASFASGTPRALSPPPPSTQNESLASLDFGLKQSNHHPRKYNMPTSTAQDVGSDVYIQSLQPKDHGKATALGLFNRPRQQFDEQQFQQRQLQMHGAPLSPSYPSRPVNEAISDRYETPITRPRSPSSPSLKSSLHGQSSSGASVKTRSRAQSAASTHAAQVTSHVDAFIQRQNEEYSALQASKGVQINTQQPPTTQSAKAMADQPASRGTFFNTFDGSDEDEDVDSPMLGRYEPPPRLAPMEVHPALRDNSQAFIFGDQMPAPSRIARPASNASADTSSPSIVHDTPDTSDSLHQSSPTKQFDSPTLGPTAGLGLSGMIRTHLRNDSDRSSFMPPSPMRSQHADHGPDPFRQRETSIASTARTINPPESTHSDPWEFDNAHRTQRGPADYTPADSAPTMSQKAQQILGQAISHRNQATSKAQQILGNDAPAQHDENVARPWHPDTMQGHQRGESTETQKEFGDKLAERARGIQERFKGAPEGEKRSKSPGPQRGDRQNPATNALHTLRQKSSKTSLVPRSNDPQPKAMKMLGMGNNTPRMDMPGRSPNMSVRGDYRFDQSYDDHSNQYTPRHRPNEFDSPRQRPSEFDPPRQRPAEFEPQNGRRTPGYGRPAPQMHMHSSQEDFERSRQRSATPNGRPPPRHRAESETGERSRSRMGRDRNEPPYHQAEYGRQGGPHQRPPPQWDQRRARGPPPVHPHGPPMENRDYERSSSAMSNRRPPPSDYFDSRSATPTMGNTPTLGASPMLTGAPRPSPRPPFPHSPMSPFQPAMSPGFAGPQSAVVSALPSPVVQMHPPPTGRTTPGVEGRPTGFSARKKSITKGMISEPTFISSTSSVPLVGLPISPRPGQIATPPVPAMNPRRRGNTMSEKSDAFPSPRMTNSPMLAEPASQAPYVDQQRPPPRQRNRLRKISSEGGGMAARARNQAMMAEFGREQLRSPAVQVFPNRSATSLGLHQEGGMF